MGELPQVEVAGESAHRICWATSCRPAPGIPQGKRPTSSTAGSPTRAARGCRDHPAETWPIFLAGLRKAEFGLMSPVDKTRTGPWAETGSAPEGFSRSPGGSASRERPPRRVVPGARSRSGSAKTTRHARPSDFVSPVGNNQIRPQLLGALFRDTVSRSYSGRKGPSLRAPAGARILQEQSGI